MAEQNPNMFIVTYTIHDDLVRDYLRDAVLIGQLGGRELDDSTYLLRRKNIPPDCTAEDVFNLVRGCLCNEHAGAKQLTETENLIVLAVDPERRYQGVIRGGDSRGAKVKKLWKRLPG